MRDDDDRLMYLAAGPMAAIVLGILLIPLRELTSASNLTFVFLAWTIVVGHLGGRGPAVATALTSALGLDFFLTRPYMRLSIDSKHDLLAFLGLALCGLVAAALGGRAGSTASARRLRSVLDEALRQLQRGGPPQERLPPVLERALSAFPLVAVSVRDHAGRVVASRGEASLVDRAPDLEAHVDDLSFAHGWRGAPEALPLAGLRVHLMEGGVGVGCLDLWRRGPGLTAEGRRLLAAVAGVIGALLALSARPVPRHLEGPAIESAWTRPGRRTSA